MFGKHEDNKLSKISYSVVALILVLILGLTCINLEKFKQDYSIRLENVEARLVVMEEQVENLESRVEALETFEYDINTEIDGVYVSLSSLDADIYNLGERFSQIESNKLRLTSVIKFTDEEFDYMCRLVMGESGGDIYENNLATAQVIVNRVLSDKYPDTLMKVMKQKGQFSGSTKRTPTANVVKACQEALYGETIIPRDVLYFWSKGTSWSGRKFYKQIGDHYFFY